MAKESESVWIVQFIKRPGSYKIMSVHKTEESAEKQKEVLVNKGNIDPHALIVEEFILHP